nr:MarR family transcriptional regulator [uncultured Cohaesibacter sp.]
MEREEADRHVGYLLFEVSRLFRRRYEERAKSFGLTLQQTRVVGYLNHHPDGVSQATLAHAVDSDPMTISGILDRLEKRKLVKRVQDPSDSRAKIVTVTQKGADLFVHAKSISRELFDQVLDNLENGHVDILLSSLRNIRDQLIDMSPDNKES